MTGGYRRTPVMQIGADIYCDTRSSSANWNALPEPTLFPDACRAWPRRRRCGPTSLLPEHRESRVRHAGRQGAAGIHRGPRELRGQKFDIAAMTAAIPQMRDQSRAHVEWIEAQLADGRPGCGQPGRPVRHQRLHEHMVRARQPAGSRRNARGISGDAGMGNADARDRAWHVERELTTAAALEIATPRRRKPPNSADPKTRTAASRAIGPGHPRRLRQDRRSRRDRRAVVAAHRDPKDDRAGEVVVHFPRAGFLVLPA